MHRRKLMTLMGALPMMSTASAQTANSTFRRVRPGEQGWPAAAQWQELEAKVGGRLVEVRSPLATCAANPGSPDCAAVFEGLKNPYYVRDNPALTQTSGWAEAWSTKTSVRAVAARTAADVAAAVDFARRHKLRLVVKGGGHSYQGTSNAPDLLLVWTRAMDDIVMHDAFVAQGCNEAPQPAVSLGAGCIWLQAYSAAARAGRYVQGGGCMTVGVAGLIQSGGFGSFSKRFGLAAAGLIEAEIVTADGKVAIANACANPDLFWGLKGGGGGSFGVITRLTLRTHRLPQWFGGAFGAIAAKSNDAYRELIRRFVAFYRDSLFTPTWGEQVKVRPDNVLEIAMVFQGIDQGAAQAAWKPFVEFVTSSPQDYAFALPLTVVALPARYFWDAGFLKKNAPQVVLQDNRSDAPDGNVFWAANLEETGWFLHAYQSTWLPAASLAPDRQAALADALYAGSRHRAVGLHFNKGLAGAPAAEIAAARDTATNPVAAEAFALAISSAYGPPAFSGIKDHEPDLVAAQRNSAAVEAAMAELRKVAPAGGAYVSESNYFQPDWQQAFWGANYARLRAVKDKYDPDGLFFVHHGVGSEDWSPDGFTRLK